MPTQTYIPLANITLGSSASTVTFSSIPTTGYRDLILISRPITTSVDTTRLRLNNDAGSNYSFVYMYSNSTGAISGTVSGNYFDIAGNGSTGATSICQIMDYSATDKHKTLLVRGGSINQNDVVAYAQRYASTTAVSYFQLFPATGSFVAGSTFALYGIAS
jgi:hypothetical protein